MRLNELLTGVRGIQRLGVGDVEVKGITLDSRQVKKGYLFAALPGTSGDGAEYIADALERGAVAILCMGAAMLQFAETPPTAWVVSEHPAQGLAQIAANFYGQGHRKLTIVGITGTNGKTTIATLLWQLAQSLGFKAGLLSTAGNRIGDRAMPTTHTTPNAIHLHQLFGQMVDAGCDSCFMEVSSHSVVQGRIWDIEFDGGIFTNLTHDHLDYHGTLANYRDAKKRFFDNLPTTAFALVNSDDKNGRVMMQNTKAAAFTYSLQKEANYRGKVLENDWHGMMLRIDDQHEIYTRLMGKFNASNLLAVYAAADLLGWPTEDVLHHLTLLQPVPGRLQTILSANGTIGVVDYAHTPDALLNVLSAINAVNHQNKKVFTVIGCGGDRDKAKRPLMAKIAVEGSTKAIFTSDNPRSEDPKVIIDEMLGGLTVSKRQNVLSIVDRAEAIRTAAALAGPGDIVLVAGKGHEGFQEIGSQRLPFSDLEILSQTLKVQTA